MMHEVQIDEELIEKAKLETGKKTDKGAIEKAVREYLRMESIRKDIRSLKGSVEIR